MREKGFEFLVYTGDSLFFDALFCVLACLRIPKHHLGGSSYQPLSGKSLLAVVIAPLRAPESMQTPETRNKTQTLAARASWLFWLSDAGLQLQTHPAPTAPL